MHGQGKLGSMATTRRVKELTRSCPKVPPKLPESCLKVVKAARKWPQDMYIGKVAKIVAVRAVNLLIIAFCTELRCKPF